MTHRAIRVLNSHIHEVVEYVCIPQVLNVLLSFSRCNLMRLKELVLVSNGTLAIERVELAESGAQARSTRLERADLRKARPVVT